MNPSDIQQSSLVAGKPLPYKSNFLDIGGYKMHYLDEGQGPVVILLHGNPTWCYFYRSLIERLKKDFRLLVPDFLGCGLSDHPRDVHFKAIERVQHLRSFVEQLGLTKYSLVMHDWGGSIGTFLALSNISAIEKIVYLNTTLTETEGLPKIIRMAAKPFFGKFLTKYTKRFLKFTTDFGVVKKLPKEVRKAYFYPYQSIDRRTAIWDFVADIPFDSSHASYSLMLDLADGLPQLSHIPVQIVWGLRDPCFHREMLSKVAQHFPQARVLEIPEASHLVLEDAPDLAGSTIRGFLTTDSNVLAEEVKAATSKVRINDSHQENALYSAFTKIAEKQPQADAVIVPSFFGDSMRYSRKSLHSMSQLVTKYQRGLQKLGLRSGDKVIMLVPAGIEFLALSYAVMGRGAIPVFVDPGMGRENLCACIEEISPQVLIGSPKAHLLRLRYKKLFAGLKFHIVASEWTPFGGPNLSFLKKFSSKELPQTSSTGIALIAFTSGATGKPKGVIFSDKMVQSQLEIFNKNFGMEVGKRDMPLLPIFSLFNLANGVCSVFPPMDSSKPLELDPQKVIRILEDLSIEYSFGSPTLWNKISEYCIRSKTSLGTLKKIFMAGAPVSQKVIATVQRVLPAGEIYTPYGATEALPVTLISAKQLQETVLVAAKTGEIGTLVGPAIPGVELKIIAAQNGVISSITEAQQLPAREIGEVIVRGTNISPQYWDRPDATLKSKIKDGESFWHRMGDVGYLDELGNLYFCGRQAHVVTYQGRSFYSVPIESVFNQHKMVRRSALVSLFNGRDIGIIIEPHPEFWPESVGARRQFCGELRDLAKSHNLTTEIERFFVHRSFPVDSRHNAKIFRDKLSQWASSEGVELDSAA